MARIKIIVRSPDRNPSEFLRESRKFFRHLNEVLRFSSKGAEWLVPGPSPGVGGDGSAARKGDRQYLGEVSDPEDRLPIIEEVILEHDLGDQTVVYREEELHNGWSRVWPERSE